MATVKAVTTKSNRKYLKVFWETLLQGDDGAVADLGKFPDKTLQISGTTGTAVPGFEGSMDSQTWVPLTTNGVDAIATVGLHYIWENPNFVRPNNAGGDGTTDLDYTLGMSSLV